LGCVKYAFSTLSRGEGYKVDAFSLLVGVSS
jgi:hypothetical protein